LWTRAPRILIEDSIALHLFLKRSPGVTRPAAERRNL